MNPSQTAMVDQALAEFGHQVDLYVTVYRRLRAKHGDAQAAADMCALFKSTPPVEVAAALSAAIVRLADGASS